MIQKPATTSMGEMKGIYELPAIPDMFLIDDRGLGRSFRDSMKDDSYLGYDKKYYQAHNAFFEDLELERFFREYLRIDGLENPRAQTVRELFFFLPRDTRTVRFRQDILKDFIADEVLSRLVEDAKNRLGKKLSEINFSATRRGLLLPYSKLLREYENVLTELTEKLGSKESAGLHLLSGFFGEMRDHLDIRVWKEYDRKIEEEEPFFLALTRRYDFTPIGLSVFGFENNAHTFTEMLEKATDRFGKIKTDSIDGDRLETMEVSLSSRTNRIRISLMDLFVQVMMQVFGNPFDGLEDHVRYTIAALNQLRFYQNAARLFSLLTGEGIPCVFPKVRDTGLREMTAEEVYNFAIEREQGKGLVPNIIRSNDTWRINIITGSNFCGKSWYMKTAGLVQLMGQVGLFVPARSASLSLVDHVFTHFPEEEGAGDIESRYSWELERAKRIFSYATPHSLTLFDEPCSGTAYEEGAEQTRTFIKISQQIGMTTYLSTHMHEIAKEVEDNKEMYPNCENLHAVTEQTSHGPRYTYKVKPGRAAHSGAAQLAQAKGCDENSLQKLLEGRILTNSLPVDVQKG